MIMFGFIIIIVITGEQASMYQATCFIKKHSWCKGEKWNKMPTQNETK